MSDVFAPVSADRLGDGVEDRDRRRRGRSGRPCPGSRRRRRSCRRPARRPAWNAPSRPVMPWTTRRVSRPTRMLMPRPRLRGGDGLGGRLVERGRGLEAGLREQDGGLRGVGADDAHDHRHVAGLLGAGLDQAPGDLVAAGDAAEDVDEDGVDLRVGQDEAHRLGRPCRTGRRRRCRGSWPARRRPA